MELVYTVLLAILPTAILSYFVYKKDVFEKEPLPSTSPLYSVDPQKVVFTPHVAWGSVEARHRLIFEVRENIIAFIKGEDRNNC